MSLIYSLSDLNFLVIVIVYYDKILFYNLEVGKIFIKHV